MQTINKLLFILAFFVSVESFASGGEEHPASDAAPASQPKPWQELQTHVSVLVGKRLQLQEALHKAIQVKKSNRNPADARKLDEEVQKAYKELKDVTEELNQKSSLLKFRYPERAAREDIRVYHSESLGDLKQIEMRVGLGAKLDHAIKVIRKTYGIKKAPPLQNPDQNLPLNREPASEVKDSNLIEAPTLHIEN